MKLSMALFLGFIQGITEFLPVSSSGHLAILQRLFGITNPDDVLGFSVLLHLGTLLAVVVVYYKDVINLAAAFFSMLFDLVRGKGARVREYPYRKFALLLIVGTLPLFAAVLFKDLVAGLYTNIAFIGCALIVTALLLQYTDNMKTGGKRLKTASYKNALTVGLFQAAAIVPGLSRSGATITGGLFSGFEREFAVKFSFILAIPAILGANILEVKEMLGKTIAPSEWMIYLAGMAIAAVSGFFAIKFITYLAKKGNFKVFSWYCLIAGLFALVYGILV